MAHTEADKPRLPVRSRARASSVVGDSKTTPCRCEPALTLLAHPDESAALGLLGYLAQAIDHSVRERRSPSYQDHAFLGFDVLGQKHALLQLRKIASATIFDPNFSRFHTHGAV